MILKVPEMSSGVDKFPTNDWIWLGQVRKLDHSPGFQIVLAKLYIIHTLSLEAWQKAQCEERSIDYRPRRIINKAKCFEMG